MIVGPAMSTGKTYGAEEGLMRAPGKMPDYLPTVLEFASMQPVDVARSFLAG